MNANIIKSSGVKGMIQNEKPNIPFKSKTSLPIVFSTKCYRDFSFKCKYQDTYGHQRDDHI